MPASRESYDVVVLGGGPSGTAAGLTLLKHGGLSVALVESSDYSSPRVGESLTPGIRPLLEYLGVWDRFRNQQSLDSFGSQAAWGSSEPRALDYMFTLHGMGWGLDRTRFDRMLARVFRERGGSLLTGTCLLACHATPDDTWLIRVRGPEQTSRRLRCRFVVDATGHASRLAKHLAVRRVVHDQLVGVARLGRLPRGRSLESVILVEACDYGWWYTAPVPGDKVSVVLMSDADIVRRAGAARADRWSSLLHAMELTTARVRGATFTDGPGVYRCHSARLERVGGDNWVAVGDAAASHDPLSSTGIPHAIGSGVHGALVAMNALFSSGNLLEAYAQNIQTDFQRYLRTHWQYYRQETRWPRLPFWQRRTTPIRIDPAATVGRAMCADEAPVMSTVHLPARLSRRLCERCEYGRPAHEIVRDFVCAHPEVPDQRAILGLQELVMSGRVRLDGVKEQMPVPAGS